MASQFVRRTEPCLTPIMRLRFRLLCRRIQWEEQDKPQRNDGKCASMPRHSVAWRGLLVLGASFHKASVVALSDFSASAPF